MKNSQGFTLIELVIVIAILGILMAIAVPAFNSVSKSARASQARAFAAQLNTYIQGVGIIAIMKTGVEAYPNPGTDVVPAVDADPEVAATEAGLALKASALGQAYAASAGAWDNGTCTAVNCTWKLLADDDYVVGYTITAGTAAGGTDYAIGWGDAKIGGACVVIGRGQNGLVSHCLPNCAVSHG